VLHQTLQQIIKLISIYTETSFSFASRLIDNGMQASPHRSPALVYTLLFTASRFTCSCAVWCMYCIAVFWLKMRSLTLQTFAAVKAVLGLLAFSYTVLLICRIVFINTFKNYPELFSHFLREML